MRCSFDPKFRIKIGKQNKSLPQGSFIKPFYFMNKIEEIEKHCGVKVIDPFMFKYWFGIWWIFIYKLYIFFYIYFYIYLYI